MKSACRLPSTPSLPPPPAPLHLHHTLRRSAASLFRETPHSSHHPCPWPSPTSNLSSVKSPSMWKRTPTSPGNKGRTGIMNMNAWTWTAIRNEGHTLKDVWRCLRWDIGRIPELSTPAYSTWRRSSCPRCHNIPAGSGARETDTIRQSSSAVEEAKGRAPSSWANIWIGPSSASIARGQFSSAKLMWWWKFLGTPNATNQCFPVLRWEREPLSIALRLRQSSRIFNDAQSFKLSFLSKPRPGPVLNYPAYPDRRTQDTSSNSTPQTMGKTNPSLPARSDSRTAVSRATSIFSI